MRQLFATAELLGGKITCLIERRFVAIVSAWFGFWISYFCGFIYQDSWRLGVAYQEIYGQFHPIGAAFICAAVAIFLACAFGVIVGDRENKKFDLRAPMVFLSVYVATFFAVISGVFA